MRVRNLAGGITLVQPHSMGFEALEKLRQLGTRKLPRKGGEAVGLSVLRRGAGAVRLLQEWHSRSA